MFRVVLVTGGTGYIGAHNCKALSKKGYEVVVFDKLVYGHREFVKWGAYRRRLEGRRSAGEGF